MNEDVIMIVSGWENLQGNMHELPHRRVSDMTLCYFSMKKAKSGKMIDLTVIDCKEAEMRGFKTEEEIYRTAAANTEKRFPLLISDWSNEISVITNEKNVFGATCMFYPGCLEQVSAKIGGDMIIIPSSIHEVLCIPSDLAEPEELQRMLYEANNDVVPEQDVLSYNIFYYDSKKNKLSAYSSDDGVVQ